MSLKVLVVITVLTGWLSWVPLAAASPTLTDLSWPNCRQPVKSYGPGIVGVSGGLVFHKNPCLRQEASWVSPYQLYVNTGYPGLAYARRFATRPLYCQSTDSACLAYNYGYNAGLDAVRYANSQLVHSSFWWLDVETENSWDPNPLLNREALSGMVAAIKKNSFLTQVGFYSYPGQWQAIVGNWQPGTPAWVASGSSRRQAAARACAVSAFTGGITFLAQYTTQLDHDLICYNHFYLSHS